MVPDLLTRYGASDVYVGRQGPDELGPRIVAAVWTSLDAMTHSVIETFDELAFYAGYLDETVDREMSALPLALWFRFERPEPPGVLRLVNGTVRPGELDSYIEDVRYGTLADEAGGRGPMALYLARHSDDTFVTLSVWNGWATIETATGGTIDRPIATRHAERLTDWSATHFEVLPNLR
jgi:hypothetical protein